MSNTIDDKLIFLLTQFVKPENKGHRYSDAVKQIKEAFAEEGYVHLPQGYVGKLEGVEIMHINGKQVMTGQEWYERFEKQYHMSADWIAGDPEMGDDAELDVLNAAKRASGIQ